MFSPGSTTMASPVVSSPRMVQLQRSMPTGKVSRIIWVCRVAPAPKLDYFFGAAGDAGAVEAGAALIPESTERGPLWRAMRTKRPIEVHIKMIADQVVSLVSRLAAPRGPKAVCEPWPPKAPARSALLPFPSSPSSLSPAPGTSVAVAICSPVHAAPRADRCRRKRNAYIDAYR